MGTGLYLNNGSVFNVANVTRSRNNYAEVTGDGLGYNLTAGEAPASYINGMDYITNDMQPHYVIDPTYGLIPSLMYNDTKSYHQSILDQVLANGAFVWGDAYNGGLYVYRTYDMNTYGIALFCGYGVDIERPNRDIFYIKNFGTARNLTEHQMRWITIFHNVLDDTYNVYYAGTFYNEDGDPTTLEAAGTPHFDNPLDPEQLTSVSYDLLSRPIPLKDQFVGVAQYVVDPTTLGVDNFQTPVNMLVAYINTTTYPDAYFIITTEQIGIRGYNDDPDYEQMGSWWGGDGNKVTDDPNKGRTNSTGGGYGVPSNYSDDVGLPDADQFSIDAVSSGFVTIYHPTAANMKAFNNWLFASFSENWWDTLKKILQDPLDFVIGAGIIKYVPTTKTANQEIKFNGIGTEIFADTINQWDTIDCGSVKVEEQFNTYLDYNGFSDVKIFLPFCGIQSLDVNDVMGSTVSVIYYIDNMTGSCIANVKVTREERDKADDSHINSVLYKFSGNVMQQLPLTNKDYASLISTVTNIATSAITSASTGGAASLGLANQVAGSLDHLKPTIQRSGNLGSNYGIMDCLNPYLILERPIRAIPAQYAKHVGYPASFTTKLGKCKGFTKGRPFTDILDNIHGTDNEKEEIRTLIENGIYI